MSFTSKSRDADPSDARPAAAEVRRRAAAGAALVGFRTALTQAVALGGNIVLARLLLPAQLGTVAFGFTILTTAKLLADGGFGVILIRRRAEPTHDELATTLGLQLGVTALIVLGGLVGWLLQGLVGGVTAVMTAALFFTAFRTPSLIHLERSLSYHLIVVVETVIAITFYAWAIATVVLGWGVWGLASASVVSEMVGTVIMLRRLRRRPLRPRVDSAAIRGMLGFGVQFQAVQVCIFARNQSINFLIVAISGLPTLGIWSLASRVMQVPFLVFAALWRVSYPAMSRLTEASADVRSTMERMISVAAVGSGALLVPLAATAHVLVPAVFGDRWRAAADVIPAASLGLIISGPVAVAASGYLYASADARTPLRATIVNSFVWTAVAIALLPSAGVSGLGVAWMAGSLVEATIFGRAMRRKLGLRPLRVLTPVLLVAAITATLGFGMSAVIPPTLIAALLVSVLTSSMYLGGCAVVRRDDLRALLALARSRPLAS